MIVRCIVRTGVADFARTRCVHGPIGGSPARVRRMKTCTCRCFFISPFPGYSSALRTQSGSPLLHSLPAPESSRMVQQVFTRWLTTRPDERDPEVVQRRLLKKIPHSCRYGDVKATERLLTKGLSLPGMDRKAFYNAAIDAYRAYGKWEKLAETMNLMRADGITIDITMYNALIVSCGNGKDWKRVLQVLEQMPAKGFKPNFDSYKAAIAALGKAYRPVRAYRLLREMPTMGIKPDLLVYNTAIHAVGSNMEWKMALDLLREMPIAGVTPDIISYNTAMQACARCGEWKNTISLLREMPEKGLTPNVISYRAAMKACGKADQQEKALDLLRELHATGMAPDRATFKDAVKACSWPDEPSQEALKILEEMKAVRGKKSVGVLTRVRYVKGPKRTKIPVKLSREMIRQQLKHVVFEGTWASKYD